MGYTAELSGMALSPGGFVIMVCMPIVGWLLSRYDARYLLLFGLAMLSFSLFHMTNFNLQIDFRTAVLARMLQAVGLAFLFVPINTSAYAHLPREKNNAASGLMNLARNIGGSVGISFVTTMLDRRTQKHLSDLMGHLSSSNAQFQATLRGMAQQFVSHGSSPADAQRQAYAMIQNAVQRQATMLSYLDNFHFLGYAILAMLPMVFLMKKTRSSGGMAVH
jgi:DHA2 family multidrug resistance protein